MGDLVFKENFCGIIHFLLTLITGTAIIAVISGIIIRFLVRQVGINIVISNKKNEYEYRSAINHRMKEIEDDIEKQINKSDEEIRKNLFDMTYEKINSLIKKVSHQSQ